MDPPVALVAAPFAAGAGVAAVGVLAFALLRRPALLPILAVAALPFRVPVKVGEESANLLVPLYLVTAAGGIAYAYERLRLGTERLARHGRRPSRVELALLLAVALYAVQSAYSTDFEQALENVVFFYVPFVLLLRLLTSIDWSRRLVAACLGVAVAQALAFVAIGFWEYGVRELLWNPKVIESNEFESYFRVNSLFFDPNIYGRFLTMVMLALTALLLWGRRRSATVLVAAALAVLWAGLLLTFSQSSFAALLVGLGVLAALRWRPRPVLAAAGAATLAGAVAVVAFSGALKLDLGSGRSLNQATSGRLELMGGGIELFAERPLWGHGSGSFAERFREREEVSSEQAVSASHTIPITIAAEQGVPGLAAYGLVLGAVLALLFGGLGGLTARDPPPPALVARAAVAAAVAALVFHTLLYAAFLEDPILWTLTGMGLGLAAAPSASARTRTRSSSP